MNGPYAIDDLDLGYVVTDEEGFDENMNPIPLERHMAIYQAKVREAKAAIQRHGVPAILAALDEMGVIKEEL